jgi:hypothetical protein
MARSMPSCKLLGVAPLSASRPTSRFCSDLNPDITDSSRAASATGAQHQAVAVMVRAVVKGGTACRCVRQRCKLNLQLHGTMHMALLHTAMVVYACRVHGISSSQYTPASRELMASCVLQRLKLMLLVCSHAFGSMRCFRRAVSASLFVLRNLSVAII